MPTVADPPRATARDFFFVRHGETDWNREGRLQGQRNVGLNALGRRQAGAAGSVLARLIERRGLEATALDFVSSPLSRTRDTMELLRGQLGLPARSYRSDPRLLELSFGRWEGLTWADIKRDYGAADGARRRDRWNFVPPGGESYAALVDRLTPWFDSLEPNTVVVAHGGVARVMLHLVTGLSPERAPNEDIHQGRVLVFDAGAAHWV